MCITKKVGVVSLAHKGASTDGCYADRYIPRTYWSGAKKSGEG